MAEFNVTLAQLSAKADELEQYNASFKSLSENLEETKNSLTTMWEGDAKESFNTAFENDMTQMNNFYNAVTLYVNSLRQIVSKYQNAENQNVEIANTRSYA